MLSRVKKKIKSNTGATLLMALLFFLLCAMAGVIVLTSGTAAAGRISGLAESEQEFYTVSSAAQLIEEEIDGQGFEATATYYDHVFQYRTPGVEPSGGMEKILKDVIKELYENNGDLYGTKFEIELNDTDAAKKMHTVEAVLKAAKVPNGEGIYYVITVDFSLKDSDRYKCRLTISALFDEKIHEYIEPPEGDNPEYLVTEVHSWAYWSHGVIEKTEKIKVED